MFSLINAIYICAYIIKKCARGNERGIAGKFAYLTSDYKKRVYKGISGEP